MEPLLCTPEEAANLLAVGRTRIYDLIRVGALESVRIGSSRRILVASLRDYLQSLSSPGQTL